MANVCLTVFMCFRYLAAVQLTPPQEGMGIAPVRSYILEQVFTLTQIVIVAWVVSVRAEPQVRSTLATEKLLDSTSDGFCIVDAVTGIIDSSSSQLQKTFGTYAKPGQLLVDWCQGEDRVRVLALLGAPDGISGMQPVLVTCTLPNVAVFDAKIVPYDMHRRKLSICVQVQGEVRCGLDPPAPTSALLVEDDREPCVFLPEDAAESEISLVLTQTEMASKRDVTTMTHCATQTELPPQVLAESGTDISRERNDFQCRLG